MFEQKIVTEWDYNWSPGLILGAFYTMFASLTCLTGSWGPVWPENGPKPKLNFRFYFPNMSPILRDTNRCLRMPVGCESRSSRSIMRSSSRLTWMVAALLRCIVTRFKGLRQIIICIWFSAGFRPNLAPRPVPTGRARQMVPNAPTISPGDQF